MISTLPKELILYIFSYLEIRSLCKLFRVNKEWSELVLDHSLWKTTHIDYINHQLIEAVEEGNIPCIRSLLRFYGNISNSRDNQGRSCLEIAIKYLDYSLIQFLLQNGAQVNQLDYEGKPLLVYACEYNDIEIAKLLINNGANVLALWEQRDIDALGWAIDNCSLEMIKLIVENGASTNKNTMMSALKRACNKAAEYKGMISMDIIDYLEKTYKKLMKNKNGVDSDDDDDYLSYTADDWKYIQVSKKRTYRAISNDTLEKFTKKKQRFDKLFT